MSRTDLSARQGTEEARSVAQGPVMPIGGAVDTDGHSDILARFVTLAGDGCPEAPRSGMVAIVDGRDARSDSFERDGARCSPSPMLTCPSSAPAAASTFASAAR
jgi:hypothetical protein